MSSKDLIGLALDGVLANKMRSLLTLLGIVIGVGAIILMISLGSSAERVISGEFADMETSQIWIHADPMLSSARQVEFNSDDHEYLKRNALGIEQALFYYMVHMQIDYEDNSRYNRVLGIEPGAEEANSLELKAGRFITKEDRAAQRKVAVVGEGMAREMTDLDEAVDLLGEEIIIDEKEFTVVGIIDQRSSYAYVNPSSDVLIPGRTGNAVWPDIFDSPYSLMLAFDAENYSGADIMAQVEHLLERRHGPLSGEETRFYYESVEENIEMTNTVIRVLNYVLGAIAAISLLVGGIGVMNIMLVSVKERTEEIGLRMALGATREEIRGQFLLETIFLSLTGGLIGVILGGLFSYLVNYIIVQFQGWWEIVIPMWIIVVSFGITVLIGVVFGYYPAYKASRMNPIEALRIE